MKILRNTPLEDTRIDQSNTPGWWIKVRNIAGIIAGICVSLLAAPLPDQVKVILTYVSIVAGAVSGTAFFARK